MIKVRWPVRDSNRVDFDFEVLRVLVSVCSGQRGWVWNVLVVRLRYIRWMLLGWLRVFGLCEYCGLRAGQFGWGHMKDEMRMCYRCWEYYD